MFGPQNGYEAFPSRSNIYAEDLMSLNPLNPVDYKKPTMQGDSRSLRTDDIVGAKPRSGFRRAPEEQAYSGLNLPSYSGKGSPSPNRLPADSNMQNDYKKNAANFFGTTPPGSPHNMGYKPAAKGQVYARPSENQISAKDAANFYGVTPPQSRPQGSQIPPKELANFYGVTPPVSRAPNRYSNQYNSNPPPLPAKEIANFYGVTPPVSRAPNAYNDPYRQNPYAKPPTNNYSSPNLPAKDIANFYGVTPPQSRAPQQNYYSQGPREPSPSKNISAKEYANFYGATPPVSRSQVPAKEVANFYGVTPPVTGNRGNIPARDVANFYGVTPPGSMKKNEVNSNFNVNAAKFFGHDGISPEFQYAADIVNRPPQQNPKGYMQNPVRERPAYQLVNTAKRIFN